MARIPTYTAEGGIPAGGTGPQASPAAFAAPARALGGLGETIAQTTAQVSRAALSYSELQKQRQEQDDAFWAANQATSLHRDLMKVYEDGKGKEDQAETFLRDAEARLTELESTAPNPNAAKRLRLAIDDNINSIYGRALNLASQVREQNRISEIEVNAQNIGEPINSSDEFTKPIAILGAQKMVAMNLGLIDSMPYSDETKRKFRGKFLETVALNVSANAPEYALELINTTDIDETRKITLRNQIDGYVTSRNKIAELNFSEKTKKGIDDAMRGNVQIKMPSDEEYKAVFGRDWEIKKEKDRLEFDFVNSVIDFSNKNGELSYANQQKIFSETIDQYSPESRKEIERRLELTRKMQNGDLAHAWLRQNNKNVQRAYDIAANAPIEQRGALITAANAMSLRYQGAPPPDEKDPEELKKYLYKVPGQFNLLDPSDAQKRADAINAMSGSRIASYMMELAAEFPDAKQRAIVWSDLVTMPQNGIKPSIQLGEMIPNKSLREVFLSSAQAAQGVSKLTEAEKKQFYDSINSDDNWKAWSSAMSPGKTAEQDPLLSSFRDAFVTYAQKLTQGDGALSPPDAVKKATEFLIKGSWEIENINGQFVAIQLRRDDLDQVPARTSAEAKDVLRKLKFAISVVPIQEIDLKNPNGDPLFPNLEFVRDENEKLSQIQNAIRSNGFWRTNEDGQGASLFLMDQFGNSFPVFDKTGKPFSITYDNVYSTPESYFGMEAVEVYGPRGTTQLVPLKGAPLREFPRFIEEKVGGTTTNVPTWRSFWDNAPRDLRAIKEVQ